MKHIDLIKLIYKHSEIIDKAYKYGFVDNVSQELIDINLFIKITDSYKLNRNYLNFADSILQRVDYSVVFGDYEKEYKELVKNKNRYLDTKNIYYKNRILHLIENLHFKFYNRDKEIQILLVRIENDTSLDIDILLENAQDIFYKIDDLIDANKRIGDFFRDGLRGIDTDIDEFLRSISGDILIYIENINNYIKHINQFIIQTKRRRIQNKKIMELSNKILFEDTKDLDEYLTMNKKTLYHTISKSNKNRVEFFADNEDIVNVSKEIKMFLSSFRIKKEAKTTTIKPQKIEKLEIVNIDKILLDLDSLKSDDIFMFIKHHKDMQECDKDEIFKLFLQVITDDRVVFEDKFNSDGIKVVRWV